MLRLTVTGFSLCAALAAVGFATSAPHSARVPPTATAFVVSGRGWGHGVGMSQYGALGFAQRGARYAQILAHYYPSTTLGRAPVARVRVLLAEGRKKLIVASPQRFRVRDGAGDLHELPAGRYPLGPALKLKLEAPKPKPLPGPLLFSTELGPLALNGKRYRGSLEIALEKGRLRAINAVGLEPYLYGVVPDEVPHTWPAEALKAQAVVARSYALAVRKSGPYDLHDDTRSQVYGGIDAEESQTNEAVDATAGRVVLHAGRVATTFFFSTSGGRTADVSHVWESSPRPYLVSVRDPYDSISPHHRWGPFALPQARLAKTLGVKGHLLEVRTTLNGSGRVDQVVGLGTGGEASVPAATVRRELGLRSTWFSVGVLALERPARPLVYGSTTRLSGIARGLTGVTIERRAGPALWERAGAVVAADGRFSLAVKPGLSTEYRLASGTARTAAVRVAVAPLVGLAAVRAAGVLRGSVKPIVPGATVVLQRREGSAWVEASRATIDPAGAFETRLALAPGAYRARVAPGGGLVPGVSRVVHVVPA